MSATAYSPAPVHGVGADGDRALTRAERSEETSALMAALATEREPATVVRLQERVILINARVAEAVANRFERRGVPTEDLRQAAYEGLVKAVLRFDPALRNDFLTYAVPTIRGELQRHFRDRGWAVRPPRRLQEIQWRANQLVEQLCQDLGREPTVEEMATSLGITVEDYVDAMAAHGCFQPVSLDAPAGSDTGTQAIGDLLPDEGPDARLDIVEARASLAPVLGRLPERDRRILYLRFFEDLSQEEVGRQVGVTQVQVSRLLARILDKVRKELDVAVPAPRPPTEPAGE